MLVIRKAKIKDISYIIDLSYKSAIFHKNLSKYCNIDKNAKDILKKHLTKDIFSKNRLVLVAEDNNKIVGYLSATIFKRPELYKIKNTGYISDLFIYPSYRKRGIGKSLFKESLSWFKKKKLKAVQLDISVENNSALKFWANLGFKDFILFKYIFIS